MPSQGGSVLAWCEQLCLKHVVVSECWVGCPGQGQKLQGNWRARIWKPSLHCERFLEIILCFTPSPDWRETLVWSMMLGWAFCRTKGYKKGWHFQHNVADGCCNGWSSALLMVVAMLFNFMLIFLLKWLFAITNVDENLDLILLSC